MRERESARETGRRTGQERANASIKVIEDKTNMAGRCGLGRIGCSGPVDGDWKYYRLSEFGRV